ncbi:uncharacterized protein BDZ99DRAFT_574442 [Mytilinidion resinicola]|uniref:Rhodopsin domain-containing protein n=1 Tax=Mytilinidion resinicola TaxID=574789 RepID=A0A6A6YA69_9PEZI|nr:uncharacterized protein BDZ99DRAFT_574442 [Mytilinidion resinicola]KAF2805519.1 hypothetical protein BDZ99DRAFT_574442 [Mytilinidion resinicola]
MAWIALVLRVRVGVKILSTFGIDDMLMTAAMAVFTVYVVVILIGIAHQMDRHYLDIDPKNFPVALKMEFLSGIFYATATPCLKASIGTLLLRFVRRKLYIYIIYVGIVVSIAGNLWTFLELIFFCTPPQHFWNPVVAGSCKAPSELARATLGQNSINFITDLVFGVLPAFVVSELQMNRNTKVSLAGILLVGNCVMVATAVRFKFVTSLPIDSPDFLYKIVDARVLSTVEIGIGCAMGSMVTLKPLFKAILHLGSSYKYGSASNRKRSDYANQLHSLDNLDNQSRANDGVLTLYPLHTTHVMAGKEPHNRSSEWERNGDDKSVEARGGGIQQDVTYTITHDKP